jgi:hypothetical protein
MRQPVQVHRHVGVLRANIGLLNERPYSEAGSGIR